MGLTNPTRCDWSLCGKALDYHQPPADTLGSVEVRLASQAPYVRRFCSLQCLANAAVAWWVDGAQDERKAQDTLLGKEQDDAIPS